MQRTFLVIFLLTIAPVAFSQDFPGHNYSNYQTVGGMLFNPASIAGGRYKVNVNLFSFNVAAANNGYGFNRKTAFKGKFNDLDENVDFFKSNNADPKSVFFNVDVIGPSFMIDMGRKAGAIGLSTRVRTLFDVKNISNNIFQLIGVANDDYFNKPFSQSGLEIDAHAFAEVGLTYSRIIWDNESHVIKGGLTGKYVIGLAMASTRINNLEVEITNKDLGLGSGVEDVVKKLQGEMSMAYSKNIDKLIDDFDPMDVWNTAAKSGNIGFDIGVEYEWYRDGKRKVPVTDRSTWMSNSLTPYTLKASVSITDIGKIKYALSDDSKIYTIQNRLSEYPLSDLDMEGDLTEYLDSLKSKGIITEKSSAVNAKVSLPTMLRVNIDWNAYKGFYVNLGAAMNMLGNSSYGARYGNYYYLTPRFESKWFSAYSPLSYNSLKQINWGVGLNVGVLFIGSGSILSGLIRDKLNNLDLHLGINVPIFKRIPKQKKAPEVIVEPVPSDRDHDGIIDEDDDCPDTPGLAKYKGCPIPDTDGDGVNDEEDKCPDVPGILKYYGCPIPDTDGDGIIDEEDHCPDVFGYERYGGCPIPDTDGDGVNDEEDKCPEESGPASNNGCPEIKQEVVEKVNMAAKEIYFATGSDKLLDKSAPALDAVLLTLQTYKSAKMNIEGHTDNTGRAESNMTLSEKRAASVKNYLISKGVAPERLFSKGYGQTNPIADNKTSAGRAKNRRVEIKLSY
ncbi:MAG: DUF5723 family protein [Prevotellaceae bacterium]|nr:DUF5723 family protein [Prevotellaceae bacterium]